MELIYLQALAGHLLGRLQDQRARRLSGDGGMATLEVVLLTGALAAIALAAVAVIVVAVGNRSRGIDGGGSPTPTSYAF